MSDSLHHTDARWIWPAQWRNGVNQYVEFRRSFSMRAADANAELLISVDSNYAAWVNGIFVDCGQYRDWPLNKTYDRLPIGRPLQKGRNELTILAYHQGENSFQYLKGDPGLIFIIRGGDTIVVSGKQTQYRRSPGYRIGPIPRTTIQLGFTFEFDARAEGETWSVIQDIDLGGGAGSRGLAPRPVEKLVVKPRAAARVCAQGVFRRDRPKSHADWSVAQFMQRDFLSSRSAREMLKSAEPVTLPLEDGIELDASFFAEGGVYFVVDVGREEAGLLELDVDADAGTYIDIANGEHLDDLRVRAAMGGRNFANRYICKEGRQTFTHYFSRLGGRFLQLHVSRSKTRFRLYYAGLRPTEYPVQVQGALVSPDSLHAQIYRVGVRTLHVCMHEHYEDPWREQALWAFDARSMALFGYYAFGEYRFPAGSLALLGGGLKDDGYLEMCAPAEISITIPSFSFAWVLAIGDYWLYSADRVFIDRILPSLQRMIRIHLAHLEQGLLPRPIGERYWHYYEWIPGLDGSDKLTSQQRSRFDAPLNLMFCLALEAAARVSQACGDEQATVEFRGAAQRLRARIAEAFWDQDEEAYLSFIGSGAPRHVSEFVESLALLAAVPPVSVASRLRQRLIEPDNGLIATTLSHCHYKFEALMMEKQKYGRWVFDTIARDWGGMLLRGATSFWETIKGGDDFEQAGSLCHGWSAVPVYFYSAYLLGVRPVEPGFRRFVVDPVAGIVNSVAGQVPTPFGIIRVAWENNGEEFQLGQLSHPDQTQSMMRPECEVENRQVEMNWRHISP